jgi:tetratricopeptide (TPR) repeat protein
VLPQKKVQAVAPGAPRVTFRQRLVRGLKSVAATLSCCVPRSNPVQNPGAKLERYTQEVAQRPGDLHAQHCLAAAHYNIGREHEYGKDPEAALASYQNAITILTRMSLQADYATDPDKRMSYDYLLAGSHARVGVLQQRLGNSLAALQSHWAGIEVLRQMKHSPSHLLDVQDALYDLLELRRALISLPEASPEALQSKQQALELLAAAQRLREATDRALEDLQKDPREDLLGRYRLGHRILARSAAEAPDDADLQRHLALFRTAFREDLRRVDAASRAARPEPRWLSDTPSYKGQSWEYSCGASSLMMAAKHLGVTKLPPHQGHRMWDQEIPLEVTQQCEGRIYQWTSGHPRATKAADNWRFSMPSNIISCARHLGLEAQVIYKPGRYSVKMKLTYPLEYLKLLIKGAIVKQDNHPKLAPNQMALMIVNGDHYVAVGADGTVKDPADRWEYASTEIMQSYMAYIDYGIWIVITKPS